MDKIHGHIQRIYGDGAYDSHDLRKKIAAKKAEPKIPPPRNAVKGDSVDEATRKRNEAISAIKGLGGDDDARALWKKLEGYHTRSLVETTMFRFKMIFGGGLRSRTWENQQIEAYVKCLVLNRMTKLGMPTGYWEEALGATG